MIIICIFLISGCSDLKACTQEGKICPDGSVVGRTGPNCEFSPCPQTCGECPLVVSPSPNFCNDGVIVAGEKNECGCLGPPQCVPKDGFLEGRVTIGPLCPVERNPPDPTCQPTTETYAAWPIAVWTSDKKAIVAQIAPSLNGTYKIALSTGDYVVDFEKQQTFGNNNLPANITINSAEITTLNIDIDTGMR